MNDNSRLSKLLDNIIWISLLLGLSFWFLDALIRAYLFEDNSLQEQFISPGAREIWIRAFVISLFIILGYFIQIMIEKWKDAVKNQQKSEERFNLLYEDTPLIYISLDEYGKIREVNRGFCDFIGYTEEDIISKRFDFFLSESSREIFIRDFEKFKTEEEIYGQEYEMIRKGGISVWVSFFGRIIGTGPDTIVRASCVLHDITTRQWTKKALAESEEKFKTICESALDGIIIMDNDGRITYWNKSAEIIFGWTRNEALGKELHLLLAPPEYHDAYRRGLEHFQKTGRGNAVGKVLELKSFTKDGRTIPIELSLAAVKLNDYWHAIGIMRDITARGKTLNHTAAHAHNG
jgi:PAS domain S-box-containing protein